MAGRRDGRASGSDRLKAVDTVQLRQLSCDGRAAEVSAAGRALRNGRDARGRRESEVRRGVYPRIDREPECQDHERVSGCNADVPGPAVGGADSGSDCVHPVVDAGEATMRGNYEIERILHLRSRNHEISVWTGECRGIREHFLPYLCLRRRPT